MENQSSESKESKMRNWIPLIATSVVLVLTTGLFWAARAVKETWQYTENQGIEMSQSLEELKGYNLQLYHATISLRDLRLKENATMANDPYYYLQSILEGMDVLYVVDQMTYERLKGSSDKDEQEVALMAKTRENKVKVMLEEYILMSSYLARNNKNYSANPYNPLE